MTSLGMLSPDGRERLSQYRQPPPATAMHRTVVGRSLKERLTRSFQWPRAHTTLMIAREPASGAPRAPRIAGMTGLALRWRPDRTVVPSPDGAEVWMFGGPGPVRLAGRGAGPLARAVAQGGSEEDILARAVELGMTRERAAEVLARWRAKGHVVEEDPSASPCHAVRLVEATAGLDDAEALARALTSIGIEVLPADAERGLVVVVVDHILAAPAARERVGEPAVVVCVRGDRALVSPVLESGVRGRCPTCLDSRLRARQAAELVAAARVGLAVPPPAPGPSAATVLACAAAIARVVAAAHPETRITAVERVAGRAELHPVVPVPGCPDCDAGGSVVRMRHLDGPLRLASERFDDGSGGGGFRTMDPEDTWDDHAHLVNDVVGLVPYVRPGPRVLRAYGSGVNAAAVDDPVAFSSRLRSGAGGKGITRSGARTGALAEALERGGLRASGAEPHRIARMADLDGAVHPNDVELFSDEQLRRAEGLAAFGLLGAPDDRGHRPVPLPFDAEAEHAWSPIVELRTGRVRWLPSSMVWFDWPGLRPGSFRGSSNGAAAGNTVEEAVLQGLLELVERDAVALWWHPMCHRPAFDLAAWGDPRIEAALAPQRELGTEVWVLDLTTDLGIPAAVAVSTGLGGTRAPMMGYGAHVDPAIAVVRALTELAQMQTYVVANGPGPVTWTGAGERIWFDTVSTDSHPWLAPHGVSAPPTPPSFGGLGEALDHVAGRIERAGLEVLWADASRPDVPLSVVRTYAPGLRHFWNRYAPGRLYDVPPLLGWRDGGYTEVDLNPLAMIL